MIKPKNTPAREVLIQMEQIAAELDLRVDKRKYGRNYRPRIDEPPGRSKHPVRSGVGVYVTPGPRPRGVEFNLEPFRDLKGTT